MKLGTLLSTGCISVAMIASALPLAATATHECVPGRPNAASYTWNFQREANTIFKDIQSDAQDALNHADDLHAVARDSHLSWKAHADQLAYLKEDINDIGVRLCRLETIRSAVAPWQQRTIDRIAVDARLMADNAQDAIVFANANRDDLWLGTYQRYVANLDDQAENLTRSVDLAVEFAGVSKEYRNLKSSMQAPASS